MSTNSTSTLRFILLLVSIASAMSVSAANSDPHTIDSLPELPLSLLSNGVQLDHTSAKTTQTSLHRAPTAPIHDRVKTDQGSIAHCPKQLEYYSSQYTTQVTYPKVVCYPNNAPSDELFVRAFKKQQKTDDPSTSKSLTRTPQPQFFKLSTYEGEKLKTPMFCSVRSGPWSASVSETQGCRWSCPLADVDWRLTVHGFPELDLAWKGTWQDIPTQIHPEMGFFMSDLANKAQPGEDPQFYQCCPAAITCPDGRCVDPQIGCGGNFP